MEKTTEQPIIADSSALVSLATDTDHNHKPATEATFRLRQADRPIILPSDVLVETVNILGKRSGHETAIKAADRLLRPGSQFILVETTSHLEAALEKFKKESPAVSLTDCIVMAVADYYGTKEIFGFDKQFENAGYHRLKPSVDWKEAA
jgi:hypothetical protein